MYAVLHQFLVVAYAIAPIAALLLAIRRGRERRTVEPVAVFLITCLTGVVLGTSLIITCAVVLRGSIRPTEVFSNWYFVISLLCLAGAVRWAVRRGSQRLLRVTLDPRGRPADPGSWRVSAAFVLQAVVLVGVGMPFIIGTMLARRVKVYTSQTPQTLAGLECDPVTFASTDGISLAGWWVPADAIPPAQLERKGERGKRWGRRTVIVCGGLGDDITRQAGILRLLAADGYNVLAFDLRGHGESGGHWTSFGDLERRDVLGAVRWLTRGRRQYAERIFGLGSGIGGAAMIAAATDADPAAQSIAAVAVCGASDNFTSLARDLSDDRLPRYVRGWALRMLVPALSISAGADLAAFSPGSLTDHLWPRPLLVMHGRADAIFPFSQGMELLRDASFPKDSAWLPTDHAGAYRSRYGARVLLEFLEKAEPLPAI
jgi:pimeloyl-ACP methyl ester carboxylesterase